MLSSLEGSNSLNLSPILTGYENVQLLRKRFETGCDNKEIVPQSPRNTIRTNCMSPKKEPNLGQSTLNKNPANAEISTVHYEDLNQTFEETFQK